MGFAYNVQGNTVIGGFHVIFYGGEENQGGKSEPWRKRSTQRVASAWPARRCCCLASPICGLSVGFPVNVFNGFAVSSLQFRGVAQDFDNPMV